MKLAGFAFFGELTGSVRRLDDPTPGQPVPSPFVDGDWFQICKTGTFYSPVYGKISITPDDLSTMYQNFKAITTPGTMVIDYDHLSDEPKNPGDAKAAGWVEDLALQDEGNSLWAKPKWTRDAATMIAKGEYRFCSPFFVTQFKDKDTGRNIGPTLRAVAITNRPFLENMQPLPSPAIAASDVAVRRAWRDPRVAVPQKFKDLRAKGQDQNRLKARTAIPTAWRTTGAAMRERGGRHMKGKPCAACGAPTIKADGTAIKWSELAEKPGAPGAITCPHCGAPVKHVPPAAAPAGPPAMAKAKPPAPGDQMADALPPGPPQPGAPPPAPAMDDEAMDEGGGDAESLDELDDDAAMDEGSDDGASLDDDAEGESLDEADGDGPSLEEAPTGSGDEDAIKRTKHQAESMAAAEGQPKPPNAHGGPGGGGPKGAKMSDVGLRAQVRRLAEKNAATEEALRLVQRRERRRLAERLVHKGLKEGKLTPKLIGNWKKPGWGLAEAFRSPKRFENWLRHTAPVIVDLEERGTAKEPEQSLQTVALADRIHTMAMAAQRSDPKLTYADAVRKVNSENRALAEQYDREMSQPTSLREISVVSSKTNIR